MKKRDFLSMTDLKTKEIWQIFALAKKLKQELKEKGRNKEYLNGKSLALIFEKQSLRTRISFEIGISQLGGHVVYLDPRDTGIGVREPVKDIAKVLSGMVNVIAARTYAHETIEILVQNAQIPVINALSDLEHPCQALTDLYTIWEIKDKFNGLTIVYVGDGENNVCHSLAIGSAMLGHHFVCASPLGYTMNKAIIKKANKYGEITEMQDPEKAVKNADVVVTDTWVSMGDEAEKEKRMKVFKKYQVNKKLMSLAMPNAIFMHCLPAYRGYEVAEEVIDGPQSVVFQEAENRLHVQKALLIYLMK